MVGKYFYGLLFILIAVIFKVANSAIARDGTVIPTFSDPCKRNDPEFNKCLKETLQKILPMFEKGVPELKIPDLDPFYIDDYSLHYDAGELIGIDATYKNMYASGLSGVQILDVRSELENPDEFDLEVDFNMPTIGIEADYTARGHMNDKPLEGDGKFNVKITNLKGTLQLSAKSTILDDVKYMEVVELKLKSHEIEDMNIEANNFCNNDPELGQQTLAVLNQFWWRILHIMSMPKINEGFERVGRPLFNQVFMAVPWDQLFNPSRR